MNDKISKELEGILKKAGIEGESESLLRQALAIDIPREDGPWLKSVFRLAAEYLKLACGIKEDATRAVPWLLFSMGMAYERNKSERRK